MNKQKRFRKPSISGHALAIARWEDNHKSWFDGDTFGLTSKRTDLQDLIGNGGTLWIVVSRGLPSGGRGYSLSFRLEKCKKHTFRSSGGFGRYAVFGDPNCSTLFANNDARLLLLGLRFEPFHPIDHTTDRLKIIGNSLQTPRCLSQADVSLLESFSKQADQWSVFISYQRAVVDRKVATKLSKSLQQVGINTFRDQEALRVGKKWWPAIQNSIDRARFFIVVLGDTTHESTYVKMELKRAIKRKLTIIVLSIGNQFHNWSSYKLNEYEDIDYDGRKWNQILNKILITINQNKY